MNGLYLTLFTLAYLYAFWVVYIAVMGAYRAHLEGRLIGIPRLLSWPLLLIGVVMDVLTQYLIATVFFVDLPAKREYLVTDRLQRYLTQPGTWRYKKARWICTHLLDLFDPRDKGHC